LPYCNFILFFKSLACIIPAKYTRKFGNKMANSSICILPQLKTTGGPSTFQLKLKDGLAARGIESHNDIYRDDIRALLITGATSDLGAILDARRRKVRIVQRLDGMNWLHKQRFTGLHHFLRSERMNLQLALIRRWFADKIVYQSDFTKDWWNRVYGPLNKPSSVIHNGVDLVTFNPSGFKPIAKDFIRILVVEGSFKGGHERDLLNAVGFADRLSKFLGKNVELVVAGNVPENLRNQVSANTLLSLNWLGIVPHEEIPDLDRSAHILFPAEINAACPNSVVEALACGLPVVGYATGSISELVGEDGGTVVPYGSDHWRLEAPVSDGLVNAAACVIDDLSRYRKSARERAESLFGLDQMVDAYLKILLDD
jgi:glycosyltransferase involved in cell wall biosynthesis